MLSSQINNLGKKLLLTIVNKEKEIEINRQLLAQNIDFDLFQIYSLLDKEKKNYINSSNLIEFLYKNGIYPNELEMQYLILFYDENGDNKLSYTEFLRMILPNNNLCLRNVAKERIGSFSSENKIPEDIEFLFIQLLEKEINYIRTINRIINEIKGQCDFDFHYVYHLLIGCQAFINKDTIRTFLINNYTNFKDDDLNFIMRRIDFNKDDKVDFFEFHKLFCFNDPNCRCTLNIKNCCLCSPRLIPNNNGNIILKDINSRLNIRLSPERGCYPSNNNYLNNSVNNNQFNNQYYMNNINNYNNSINENISYNLGLRKRPERGFVNKNNNEYNENDNIQSEENQNNLENINNENNNISINDLYNSNNNNEINNNFFENNPTQTYCHICNNFPCKCLEIANLRAENELIEYLNECIKMENKIEKAKVDLSLRSDFNVEDAFKIFERENKKYISDADLIYGLNTLDIYPSQKDFLLIKRRLNPRKTENIIYSDFFDFVIPFEKDYRIMVERRNFPKNYTVHNKPDVFLLSTKLYFSNLFNVIIECENKIDNLRNLSCYVRNYIDNIFRNIDRNCIGSISELDLISYLKSRGIFTNDIDSRLLFNRLDKNKDNKIECWELYDELQITQ